MGKDLITIVVPTYNSAGKVELTLDSIKDQSYQNIELIVCDDCSKDNSIEVVEKFLVLNKERFENTVFIRNEKNVGTVKNIQKAYKIAKGKIIKPLAAGDLLYSQDTLEYICEYFNKYNPLIACGLQRSFNVENNVFQEVNFFRPRPEDFMSFVSHEDTLKRMLFLGHFATGAGLILNRELFEKYNYFLPEDVRYTEDIIQLWLTMDKIEIKIIEEFIIWYEYGTGISTSAAEYPTKVDLDQLNFYKWLLNKYSNDKQYKKYLKLAIKMKEFDNSIYGKVKKTLVTLIYPDIFIMRINSKIKEKKSLKNLDEYTSKLISKQVNTFKDKIYNFYNVK